MTILVGREAEHGAVWIRGDEIRMVVAIGGKLPTASTVGVHPKARLKSCAPTETYPLLLISGHRRYSRSSVEKLRRDGWTFVGYPDSWDLGEPTPLGLGYTPKTGDILAGRKLGRVARSTLLLLTDSVPGTAGEQPSIGPIVGLYGNILQNWRDLIPFEKLPARVAGSPKTTIEQVAVFLGETLEHQRAQKATAPARDAAAAKIAADRAANFTALTAKIDQILAQTAPPVAPPLTAQIFRMIQDRKITTLAQVSSFEDGLAAVRWLLDEHDRLTSQKVLHNAAEMDWKREQKILETELNELRAVVMRTVPILSSSGQGWTSLPAEVESIVARRAELTELAVSLTEQLDNMTAHRNRWQATHRDLVAAVGSALGIEPTSEDYAGTSIADEIPKVVFRRQTEAVTMCAVLVAGVLGAGFVSIYQP